MLAEVLVFIPSIANFRVNWINERLVSARLAALAAEARPDGVIPAMVRREILSTAQVRAVAIKRGNIRRLVLPADEPLIIDASFDLRESPDQPFWQRVLHRVALIRDALYVFIAPSGRMILVYGRGDMMAAPPSAATPGDLDFVEVALPEEPLRQAMLRHGLNILILSIIISVIAAAAVYFTLIKVLVRPMMRITRNMLHFGEDPEDASRIIEPGRRADEIGIAEGELARMQTQLNQLLHQRRRLAELGLAVSKINHDLRNMLASAQLVSDRLTMVEDPEVKKVAPRLVRAIDRAVALCTQTLDYSSRNLDKLTRSDFPLAELIDEVFADEEVATPASSLQHCVSAELTMNGDRAHIYRVFANLTHNALQAGATSVKVSPVGDSAEVIDVIDDGPGIPEELRDELF
jgi:signal transduction histidine kinase